MEPAEFTESWLGCSMVRSSLIGCMAGAVSLWTVVHWGA